MNNIFRTIPTEASEYEIEAIREQAEIELEGKIESAIEGGSWPRFGFTTTQEFNNAEEYRTWLEDVMEEEIKDITIIEVADNDEIN